MVNLDDNHKAVILIVDDNPVNLKLVDNLLDNAGFRTLVSTSGERALQQAKRLPPDLILLDILMPGLDGFETCRRFKANTETTEIPIIFMTALSDVSNKVAGFEAGAVDYVTKPFQQEELLARVRLHLTMLGLQRKMRREIEQRTQAENSLALREQYLTALVELQKLLLGTSLQTQVYGDVLKLIGEASQVSRVYFFENNEYSEGEIRISLQAEWCNTGVSPTIDHLRLQQLSYDDYAPYWYDALKEGGLIISTLPELPKREQQCARNLDVYSFMLLPIRVEGQFSGFIGLCSCDPRIWETVEIDLLWTATASITMHHERLLAETALQEANEILHQMATMDGLTQIANRRRFDEYLQESWQHALEKEEELSLILCDIDYFKAFNDTYGHQTGDDCLRQVAGAITNATKRGTDLVARYGGEEFAIVLPGTTAQGSLHVAKRVQDEVAKLQIPHNKSRVSEYITLSIGGASVYPNLEISPAKLVAVADEALYQAKARGRNRIVVSQDVFTSLTSP